MQPVRIKGNPFNAAACLTNLGRFREEYAGFIRDNAELGADLDDLEEKLRAADFDRIERNVALCRESLGNILTRLEEIAEDQQRLYDESPLLCEEGALYKSTKYFEVKRSLELRLAALL